MKSITWAVLIGVAVVAVGLIFGVAGIFLAPILGVVAIVAILIWLGERKAQHKPPIE